MACPRFDEFRGQNRGKAVCSMPRISFAAGLTLPHQAKPLQKRKRWIVLACIFFIIPSSQGAEELFWFEGFNLVFVNDRKNYGEAVYLLSNSMHLARPCSTVSASSFNCNRPATTLVVAGSASVDCRGVLSSSFRAFASAPLPSSSSSTSE